MLLGCMTYPVRPCSGPLGLPCVRLSASLLQSPPPSPIISSPAPPLLIQQCYRHPSLFTTLPPSHKHMRQCLISCCSPSVQHSPIWQHNPQLPPPFVAWCRLVWSRIWAVLSQYFSAVGCHSNLAVAMYAVDSLRQVRGGREGRGGHATAGTAQHRPTQHQGLRRHRPLHWTWQHLPHQTDLCCITEQRYSFAADMVLKGSHLGVHR